MAAKETGVVAGSAGADGRTAIVAFEGSLDLDSASDAERRIVDAGRGDRTRMIIDLSATTHLDSAGVSALMTGIRRSGLRTRDVALVCADRGMLGVLEITRVDRLVRVHPSLDAALAAGRDR